MKMERVDLEDKSEANVNKENRETRLLQSISPQIGQWFSEQQYTHSKQRSDIRSKFIEFTLYRYIETTAPRNDNITSKDNVKTVWLLEYSLVGILAMEYSCNLNAHLCNCTQPHFNTNQVLHVNIAAFSLT